MARTARIERRIIIRALDGSAYTIDPQECSIEDVGGQLALQLLVGQRLSIVPIAHEEMARLRSRRELVYTSW